jgi:hypothetical protein
VVEGSSVNITGNGGSKIITNNADLSDPIRTWWEVDFDSLNTEVQCHPYTKAYLAMKKLNRTIQGVIYIHNYLTYAKKFLKVTKVMDFKVQKNVKGGVEVDIDTVIARYDRVYKYCKNLIHVFPNDIAVGKLSI